MLLSTLRTRFSLLNESADFRWLWLATLISRMGDWFEMVAMNLYVLKLTNSATALGGLLAMNAIPMLLVSPFAGVVVDRLPRRQVIIVANLVLALLFCLVPFATLLWQVYAIAVLARIALCFLKPAQGALLPDLVAGEQVLAANAALSVVNNVTLLIGPGLAGLLVAAYGVGPAFWIDAASFAFAALCIGQIRKGELKPGRAQATSAQSITTLWRSWNQDLHLALRHTLDDSLLRVMLICNLISAIAQAGLLTIEVIYIKDVLGGGEVGYGLLYTVCGIGALAASAMITPLTRRFSLTGVYVACVLFTGLIYFPYGNIQLLWVAIPLAVIHTIPWVISWILRDTIVQMWAPEAMRGRVISLFSAQEGAGQIIVALIFAPLTDLWGVRTILNISGVLYTLLGIYAVAQRGVLSAVEKRQKGTNYGAV